ncbi:MAG: 6-bladed beta-propeller [Candidatus Saccharicenans sp.]|nr:6-bladed beta-propeller [Candidatus Saccharicenans sp.]
MTKTKGQTGLLDRLIRLLLLTFLIITPHSAQGQQLKIRTAKEIPLAGAKDRPFFFKPVTMQFSPAGLLISESGENCLKLVGTDGRLKLTIGKQGPGPEEFDSPMGLDLFENRIYVADSFNRQVKIFNLEGKLLGSFRTDIIPVHLVVLAADRIIVSNRPNPLTGQESILYCYDSRGTKKWQAVNPVPSPDSVYFSLINEVFLKKDPNGNVFLIHRYNDPQILKIDAEGKITGKIKLDESYPLNRVEIPLKNGKKQIIIICWNVAHHGDKFYLQVPDKDRRGDFVPGKEVFVIDSNGQVVEKIRFPQSVRLLATDGSTFYIINTEDELYAYGVDQE